MYLPDSVRQCLEKLESNNFACYAVGGCVRDWLLGLTPHDYDLCTNALPGQIKEIFADHTLVLAGEKHGTVGVVTTGDVIEITTFRTEGDYADNRHPGWVNFETDIAADLSRRDFTVNAMAWSPTRGLADPFGGAQDLQSGVLRAVGDAPTRFEEDALRILRGCRFAVRFGLQIEEKTLQAMYDKAPLLENIARERIFEELCKLLPLVKVEDLLRFAPILKVIIPELTPTIGFAQHNKHHIYDVYTHICNVVAAVPPVLSLRWAALLHDLGKPSTLTFGEDGQGHYYGHAEVGAQMADDILHRLKAPTALREEVVFLISRHMNRPEADKRILRRHLSRWGEEKLRKLLQLQQADIGGKGVQDGDFDFPEMHRILDALIAENGCLTIRDLAVNGHDLMALGITGRSIGQEMNRLLTMVLDEEIENEKSALLAEVRRTL